MIPDLGARHIHFVGAGGIGMSALALLLLAEGYTVSGSDRSDGEQLDALRVAGAHVHVGHEAGAVDGAGLVVVSSAIGPDNPELREARERHIPIIKRAELLAIIANAGRCVAVAGTHGKTTTSALVAHILVEAGLDPTVLIGGIPLASGSNMRIGGDVVVVEADEYDASFLRLRPEVAAILNVEPDHLDFYPTPAAFRDAFRRFAGGVSRALVCCADDPDMQSVVADSPASVCTYGTGAGEWRAEGVREEGGVARFTVVHGEQSWEAISPLAGVHNVRNALAALVLAREIGVPEALSLAGLRTFRGVARRSERKGERAGVLVLDDYAHHPTEIRTTLSAIKQRFGRPLRVVFQPHTYSRTRAFWDDFTAAFGDADAVYMMDIYAARERDTLGVSGRALAEATAARRDGVVFTGDADATLHRVLRDARPGDLVVTMGAGDVYRLGPELLEGLAR